MRAIIALAVLVGCAETETTEEAEVANSFERNIRKCSTFRRNNLGYVLFKFEL